MSYIVTGIGGAAFVTSADGTTTLLPGIPIFETPPAQAALLAGLVSDADNVFAPAVGAAGALSLLPALLDDGDSFFAPTVVALNAAQSLLPARVSDDGAEVKPADIDNPPGHGKRRFRPPLVVDADNIRASAIGASVKPGSVSSDDVIYAPPSITAARRPTLVPSDDSIPAFVVTLFLQPNIVLEPDVIGSSDVGWHLFSDETFTDADAGFGFDAFAYADLLPDYFGDEESPETYAFKLQQLTGGIPLPKPIGLTGSLSQRRRLTGSIAQTRRLTGSMNKTVRLTGSIGPRISSGKKKR